MGERKEEREKRWLVSSVVVASSSSSSVSARTRFAVCLFARALILDCMPVML